MDATSVSQDQARPEDKPQPQEPTPTHRGVGTWPLWFFMTPIIYVLSIGPVAKVDLALHRSQKPRRVDHALEIIYFPVIWCAAHSHPFDRAIRWYNFSVWKLDADQP